MVGFAFCAFALFSTYVATRRSLAAGLQMLVVIGYFYGIGRGRYPDMLTHFPFDCALVTVYAVHFLTRRASPEVAHRSEIAALWTKALVIWPVICLAFSPLIAASQPLVIQLVGFRGAVVMLPCMILGAQLQRTDVDKLAVTFAVMNLVALGFGLIEYFYGIAAVLPHNYTTEIMYLSHDITADGTTYHRIPSMFSSSHAYGGTMALTVPFLVHGQEAGRNARLLCLAGVAAAVIGIFLCGARLPVIQLGAATVYVVMTLRLRGGTLFGLAMVGACVYYVVTHNERFQRFETLSDTDYLSARFSTSVNVSFLDALGDYPVGAGLASAFGTSIPFFLFDYATTQIGIESEYGHTLVEQGIPGLLLLVGLVAWTISRTRVPWTITAAASSYASALVIVTWLTAAFGAGLLAGAPGSAFFLLLTGMRLAQGPSRAPRLALRHIGARREGVRVLAPRQASTAR